MPTTTLTADDAVALAQSIHDLAVSLGDYKFEHWDELGEAERSKLNEQQLSLLTSSSDMVTLAVGIALDATQTSVAQIQQATAEALNAVRTIKTVKKVITIGTAAIGLASAIASKDPGAIAKNTQSLVAAVTAKV